jgi:hypothetical protein
MPPVDHWRVADFPMFHFVTFDAGTLPLLLCTAASAIVKTNSIRAIYAAVPRKHRM